MNKQVTLNILRAELHRQEEALLFHKAEIAYLWDMCDVSKKNNPHMQVLFNQLNQHKEYARQTRRQLKCIRDSIRVIKKVVGVLYV